MLKYILKRLVISIITIWAIATVCFFLLRLLPGNPFILQNPLKMTNAQEMMHYYGLDRPLLEQYISYMNNLIHLDFGYSLTNAGRSVNMVIATYFPVTAQLGLQALVVGIPIGLLLGVISAVYRSSKFDYGCQVVGIINSSIPSFIMASLMQLVLGVYLHWFPISQWLSFKHTIMPTMILSLGLIFGHCRSMRTLMLEVGQQDYLKTAKSKGISKIRIVAFHQIRNAILPMVTNLGMEVAGMLMGSYIIEKTFSIPGLGNYFTNSITSLDYTMVLGLVVFQAALVVTANFIVDILYGLVDPRVRIT